MMSHFYSIAIHIQSLEAVYRGSETKLQVTENVWQCYKMTHRVLFLFIFLSKNLTANTMERVPFQHPKNE